MNKRIDYEAQISTKQLLSLNYISHALKDKELRFSSVQQRVLGIRDSENNFTNLGLWLSDQNPFTTKITTFKTDNFSEIEDKVEFTGSLLKQYDDIMEYLASVNHVHSTFIRGRREDAWNYPKDSLNEAVLNMIIHRNYEINCSNAILVMNDRIEMTSYGGLPFGIQFDELFIGMSVPRNKHLANFFKHIGLTGGFGLGVGKIRDNYYQSLAFPKFRVNEDVFKVTLPNQQSSFKNEDENDVHLSLAETNKMLTMLELLREQKMLSKKQIQDCLQVSSTRCLIILEYLVNKEYLETVDTDKGTMYCRPR